MYSANSFEKNFDIHMKENEPRPGHHKCEVQNSNFQKNLLGKHDRGKSTRIW